MKDPNEYCKKINCIVLASCNQICDGYVDWRINYPIPRSKESEELIPCMECILTLDMCNRTKPKCKHCEHRVNY